MSEVFISYVNEDRRAVDFIASILSENGVKVWLDREKLQPGARWKSAIREAIKNGTYFISIYSKQRQGRSVSYANEELVLAIEEIRKRPTDKSWFIPVTIDDCIVEDREIGGGELLSDLQRCDLTDWVPGITRLLNVLGVEEPTLDLGQPLAPGLPSVVEIVSGYLRYDILPDLPQIFQGLEYRVAKGWCQRKDAVKLSHIWKLLRQ